ATSPPTSASWASPSSRESRGTKPDLAIPAGGPRRIFGAHAAHCPHAFGMGTPAGFRSSSPPRNHGAGTPEGVRSLRCSAAPSIWTTCAPNLSPRSPAMIARVIVTPKPVVNDPQGLTVKQGLTSLGFREVEDVRVGKYIEVSLEAETMHEARERVEAMCRQLLANHVIEDFHFELDHDGGKH